MTTPEQPDSYLAQWWGAEMAPPDWETARPGFGISAAGGLIGHTDPTRPLVAVDPGCTYRLPTSAVAAFQPNEFLRDLNARGGWAPVTKGWVPWMVRRNDKNGTWLVVGPREPVGTDGGYVARLYAVHAEWRAAFDDAFWRANHDYLYRWLTGTGRSV